MSPKSSESTTTMDNASMHTTSSSASTLKGIFTKTLKLKDNSGVSSSTAAPKKRTPKDYKAAAIHHEAVAQYLALR
ncbi:uncharacterized protein ACLA_093940 [Aspergillus clavatus NRRL 1]|uniref:Uncharacterized protein n=1 Tax=Aspergillus clavatus (strain ATCC 1007 / CBS 513.65 / DSM 816 / NCTC 3887 / NRRL 1 / QM 1276 / 107) TaxID=344612 RepID=A1CFP6_ASPCL|nr:uncharacterized protein ACLA_093940 [Aspergillus clavatus NRRL 1]EAW11695.1 hypothetical protein ACLA_093940 [Aspergillus clavatus NRRL 1]